jgi:hypothetical protein
VQHCQRAFFTDLIDYAGLFPPAGLSMNTAVSNWIDYEHGDDAFMLNSFVCPAWRLDELLPFLRGREERFPVSVIIRPGPDLAGDIGNAMDFGGRVEAVEIVGVEGNLKDIDLSLATEISSRLRDKGVPGHYWFETGFPSGWDERLPEFLTGLPVLCGLKVRCGGLVAEAFPSVTEVAGAIRLSAETNRAMKATAGLHHPLPRRDEEIGVRMHGFLNVFGALVLAEIHKLDQGRVEEILEDDDPKSFTFTEETFSWRDLAVELGDLGFLTSFGSCSFDEPREDLRALGLL